MTRMFQGRIAPLAAAALLLGGCGLEGLANLYGGDDYTQPVSTIRGAVVLPAPDLTVLNSAGEEIEPFDLKVAEGTYEIQLISGAYSGLRVRATQGQAILETFVPELDPESGVEGVDLDVTSTANVKFVEGLLGPNEKTLANLSDDLVCIMGKKLEARYAAGGPEAQVLAMMERINGKADLKVSTETRVFQTPVVSVDATTGGYLVEKSALNPSWISRSLFDYDANGTLNQTTEVFDAAFVTGLKNVELSAPPDPTRIRVVFAVDFNDGKKAGNCTDINRFRWVRDEPGRQMYFVGGIHQTSPIQSTEIDAMLGNRGGWTPNQVPMYDDGTHGDQVADDNVWSVFFDLPRGVRIGYKYTWGNQGDLWTGTEEWPGNQRILEVNDVNGDVYVYRFDNFGDEATNKDLANLNGRSGGSLDWNEDLNGDGYPEASEVPVDVDNDCVPDGFVTPEWVPALTISCEEFVAN